MSLEENILKHKKVLEILSKQPDETNELKAVKKIWNIYEELVKLCDEKNLPNGGHLKRLKYICEQVESAVNFPLYYYKNIIALCGQFSSGKTSMINSFLKNNVLPTSIEPTTALNTYVVYDDKDKDDTLYIRNHFSGRTKIDEDLYDFVTHSFSNEYHQNVRNMVKYVSLHTQKLNFPNIALLDTPGYTGESSNSSLEEDDKNMAIEGIKGADYVIWVIDITNGTIKEDDIRFLEDYAYDKPKLIVLNKADLLPKSRAEEVYNNIKTTLYNEGLDDIKIYPYSSLYPEDYPNTYKILFNVFEEVDNKIKDGRIEDIKELFKSFGEYYKDKEKKLASYTKIINIAKMDNMFSNVLDNDSIKTSLKTIIEERENIKSILSKLPNFGYEFETLVKKVFHNYNKYKTSFSNQFKTEKMNSLYNYSFVIFHPNGKAEAKYRHIYSSDSIFMKALHYNNNRKFSEAVSELECLPNYYRGIGEFWYYLGIVYYNMVNYSKSKECLIQARSLDSSNSAVNELLNVINNELNKVSNTSTEDFSKNEYTFVIFHPNSKAEAKYRHIYSSDSIFMKALHYNNNRKFSEAISELECLPNYYRGIGEFWYYLGIVYYNMVNYSKSKECLIQARSLDPSNSAVNELLYKFIRT